MSVIRLSAAAVAYRLAFLGAFAGTAAGLARAAEGRLPARDSRAQEVKTLNTPRAFRRVNSKAEWQQHARKIREQVMVSCGLWPPPLKAPINAKVFDRIDRDGYSVEKVLLETYPGFFLAGNLYRPSGAGPFPAILNPHGHWPNGRFADTKDGSIAARCINFARQGMIAFSYDMAGYNDTMQSGPHGEFAVEPRNALWSVSLMGLQTWNSVRALDFLESLPDVDRTRLACTGESGGGTQTFILGAIDARLACQAPIVMVSHSMQGGCLCENAPGLRIDHSNMEIAAAPAPRPQILVAATGDWTKTTLTIEGPSIERIYKLFDATDHLRYQIFEAPHNYNQTTREAVYAWFGRWLGNQPEVTPVREQIYAPEPEENLRVLRDDKLPAGALTKKQLIDSLIVGHRTQLAALAPRDRASLDRFQSAMLPAWRHTLQVSLPEDGLIIERAEVVKDEKYVASSFHLGREGRGDRLPALLLSPLADRLHMTVVLIHPDGMTAFLEGVRQPAGLAQKFLEQGISVLLLDTFLTGSLAHEASSAKRDYSANFFSTYNKTDLQERVQDIITAAAFAHRYSKGTRRVILCGTGRAGLWALLAAPAADAVIADCDGLPADPDTFLARDLFVPGFHALGGFSTAALLAAPKGLLLHHVADGFPVDTIRHGYEGVGAMEQFTTSAGRLTDEAVVRWAVEQGQRLR